MLARDERTFALNKSDAQVGGVARLRAHSERICLKKEQGARTDLVVRPNS